MSERTDPSLLKLLAAVELHRPQGYDVFGRPTSDSAEVQYIRCDECHQSVSARGCNTWRTAHGGT